MPSCDCGDAPDACCRYATHTRNIGTPTSIFDRSYSYDAADNVTAITDNKTASNSQTFQYDDLNRLTCWKLNSTSCTQTYAYNPIGNLTSKAGVSYTYPAAGSARPHTPSIVGGAAYSYDANGNLTSGGGRTYTWNAENRPTQISQTSGTESYAYDADGERVSVTRGSVTTVYLEGLWEEVVGGSPRLYYHSSMGRRRWCTSTAATSATCTPTTWAARAW